MLRRLAAVLGLLVPAALALALFPLLVLAAPAGAAPAQPRLTQPTYSYANAIRESVRVRAPIDSDGDGVDDWIAVDIVRPRTTSQVPVILEASPYYTCCGRGNEFQLKTYEPDGTIKSMPLFYDNYFVPRGYAFVAVDLPGTGRSGGCPDVGGQAEVSAVTAVIQWLRGGGLAHNLSGQAVHATWSTGNIGMIGKSWDASVANAVAATGAPGLKTVVDISGISSWYDYERLGGVLRRPDAVRTLGELVAARPTACAPFLQQDQTAAADATGDFDDFWATRDYRTDASKVRASFLVSSGLNDLNVTTNQFSSWWSQLAADGVPRQIWLSQDGHVDPFDYRRAAWVEQLHRWFDRWLLGRRTGVMSEPQATIQRPDGTWVTASSWPASPVTPQVYGLATTAGVAGRIGLRSAGQVAVIDRPNLDETDTVAYPRRIVPGRTVFLTPRLQSPVHLSGVGSVQLRIRVDRPTTELTVRLVDYGWQRRIDYESPGEGIVTSQYRTCWGASSTIDSSCYFATYQRYVTSPADVLARGWLDAAHYLTLDRATPLVPGRWYTVTIPLTPIEDVIAAGHHIGLVVSQADTVQTDPSVRDARLHVNLAGSSLTLPITASG